jgi:hypothetical protein
MFRAFDVPGVCSGSSAASHGAIARVLALLLCWKVFVVTFAGHGTTYVGAGHLHLRNRNLRFRNLDSETMATSCHDGRLMWRPVFDDGFLPIRDVVRAF